MGPPDYRYGMDLGVYGVTLWGCGGDTGLWDPLDTDMGFDLGSMGCGGKKGPWDPLFTDMGWILGSMGCGGKKWPWDPLVTDMGWDLGSVGYECNTGDVGCGGDTGPWDPLVTDMGWIWGLWGMNVTQGCGTPCLQIWGEFWGLWALGTAESQGGRSRAAGLKDSNPPPHSRAPQHPFSPPHLQAVCGAPHPPGSP